MIFVSRHDVRIWTNAIASKNRKQCNLQIIRGEATGTLGFLTGFYGLTILPPEFQTIMGLLLANSRELCIFIDDELIVPKGTMNNSLAKAWEILKTLGYANLQLKVGKCIFAVDNIESLGFILTRTGVSPVNEKIQETSGKLRQGKLKELICFLGAVNQLEIFIRDMANICSPFRSILKRDTDWKWTEDHEEAPKNK